MPHSPKLETIEDQAAHAVDPATPLFGLDGANAGKTPHRCPICQGHGQVAGGFFNAIAGCGWSSTTIADPCRPCGGTGIIYT